METKKNYKFTVEEFNKLFVEAKEITMTGKIDFCRLAAKDMLPYLIENSIEMSDILWLIFQAKNAGGDNLKENYQDKENGNGREVIGWYVRPLKGETIYIKVGQCVVENNVKKSIADCKDGEQILSYLRKVLVG